MARLAVPDSLEELHSLLEQVGRDHPDLAQADLMMFETAVIEIAGNVIEHGQPAGKVAFTFAFTVWPDRLECLLDDSSSSLVPALDDNVLPESDLAESGRGLALANAALDVMECERIDGINHWKLIRLRH